SGPCWLMLTSTCGGAGDSRLSEITREMERNRRPRSSSLDSSSRRSIRQLEKLYTSSTARINAMAANGGTLRLLGRGRERLYLPGMNPARGNTIGQQSP